MVCVDFPLPLLYLVMYENILVFLLPGQNTSNEEADINANQDRLSRNLKMMEIDDLQASIDLPLAPLSIKVWSTSCHQESGVNFFNWDAWFDVSESRIQGITLILNKLVLLKLPEIPVSEMIQ